MNPQAPQQAITVPVTPDAVLQYQKSVDQAKSFVSREINHFEPSATFANLLKACSDVSDVGVAAQKAHHKILNNLACTFTHIRKEHADKLQSLQDEITRLKVANEKQEEEITRLKEANEKQKEANEKQKKEIGELQKQLNAVFQTVLSRAVEGEEREGGEGGSGE
ncbi:hypothetical protein niasHT_023383 [Heterodera trifolii]|uniref:Uncharacterized protein n=1 Tax=Heterodera trifolii TaxID=157864 RepID=A0ABD2K4F0_9BILA